MIEIKWVGKCRRTQKLGSRLKQKLGLDAQLTQSNANKRHIHSESNFPREGVRVGKYLPENYAMSFVNLCCFIDP